MENFSYIVYSKVIFRVCQEALTNSLRHGKAKNVNIILRSSGNKLSLFIFDDGCGCSQIKKGFGLSGMEQRVKDLGGTLVFGSDGESGFNIRMEIPLSSEGLQQ
jgi:signal transduction histidine kinase